MKLYISGPMSGRPDFNRPAFAMAQEALESLNPIADVVILSPVTATVPPPPASADEVWRACMRQALDMLLDSDGVALLGGWSDSPGACAEHALAVAAGLPCWPVESWLALGRRASTGPRPLRYQLDIEWSPEPGRRAFDIVNIRKPDPYRYSYPVSGVARRRDVADDWSKP